MGREERQRRGTRGAYSWTLVELTQAAARERELLRSEMRPPALEVCAQLDGADSADPVLGRTRGDRAAARLLPDPAMTLIVHPER